MSKIVTALLLVLALGVGFLGGLFLPRESQGQATSVSINPKPMTSYERGWLITQCYGIQEANYVGLRTGESAPTGATPGNTEKCLNAIGKLP